MSGSEPIPSIKGSVFASVVEDVAKARAEAGPGLDLARWLLPEDLALLDEEIVISRWYDIRCYTRMNELLRDIVGEGGNEYLRERGRHTARRLLEAGLYAQLEYTTRAAVATAKPEERFEAFGRDLRLLTTISASILNFSRWEPSVDADHGDRYRIDVVDAEDFPEVLCWRSDGFVNEMAALHGDADIWRWERPERERIVFRMVRAL